MLIQCTLQACDAAFNTSGFHAVFLHLMHLVKLGTDNFLQLILFEFASVRLKGGSQPQETVKT